MTSIIEARVKQGYIGDRYLQRDIAIDILKKYGQNIPPIVFQDILNKVIASPDAFEIAMSKRENKILPNQAGYQGNLCFSPATYAYLDTIEHTRTPNILDIIRQYRTVCRGFIQHESEIGDARDAAIASSVSIASLKHVLGETVLKNEFDYLESAQIKSDLTFEELVRTAFQFVRMFVPGTDGSMDLISALTSIDNGTGEILPAYERIVVAFFGICDVSVFGTFLARLKKAGRIKDFIKILKNQSGNFSKIIERHLSQGGQISNEVQDILRKFGKMMGNTFEVIPTSNRLPKPGTNIHLRRSDGSIQEVTVSGYQGNHVIFNDSTGSGKIRPISEIMLNDQVGKGVDADNLYGIITSIGGYDRNHFGKTVISAFVTRNMKIDGKYIQNVLLDGDLITLSLEGGKKIIIHGEGELEKIINTFPQIYGISNIRMFHRMKSIRVVGGYIGKEYFDSLSKINNFPRQLAAGCSVVSVFLFFLYSYSR